MEEDDKIMSLMARRKKSIVGISCCFSGATQHQNRESFDAASYSSTHIPHDPSPRRSPSAWFKSRTNDFAPEMKGKCRNFISRMARQRRHSADFSYDPLSYSLNFDDDALNSTDDEFHAMNFTTRLPVSPPRRTTITKMPFDHNLPRTVLLSRSSDAAADRWKREESATPRIEATGSDDLKRGFKALSVSVKRSSVNEPPVGAPGPRAAAVAEVKKSLEADYEVTKPVGISSNREILVRLC